MWKCINNLISDKHSKPSDEIIFGDNKYTMPNEISENFNAYFVNSIVDLNRSIPAPELDVNYTYEQSEYRFKFKLTNIDQMISIVKCLSKKVNKAERCNSQVWLDAIEYVGYFLMKIINESLSNGYFPGA